MNKGFKIICLNCGRETIFTPDDMNSETDNQNIGVYPYDYDGGIQISCDCGYDLNI